MTTSRTRRELLMVGVTLMAAICVPALADAGPSNMERSVGYQAQLAGVPQECIAKFTTADAAKIKRFGENPKDSSARRQRKIRKYVEKICRTR